MIDRKALAGAQPGEPCSQPAGQGTWGQAQVGLCGQVQGGHQAEAGQAGRVDGGQGPGQSRRGQQLSITSHATPHCKDIKKAATCQSDHLSVEMAGEMPLPSLAILPT